MKKTVLFATSILFSLSLLGGSSTQSVVVNGTCESGGTYPSCNAGAVTFTGTNLPNRVRIVLTDSSGSPLDDSIYVTTNGCLSFTETLFQGDYTIRIKHGGNLNGGTILYEDNLTIQ
jgi:hypothetical protein